MSSFIFICQILIVGAILRFSDPYLIQNSVPIIWRNSNKDIIEGYKEISFKYLLLSPCSSKFLTPEIVPEDDLQTAREFCEEKYRTYYLGEMQKLCPLPTYSHIRRKRALPVLALMGILAGGLSIHNSLENEKTLKTKSNQQLAMIKEDREAIMKLQRKFSKLLENMQHHQQHFDELKRKHIHTSYAVATLVNMLATQNKLIRDATRQWKNNIVSDSILDIFNLTLPCFPKCTLKNAKPKSCFISDGMLSMRFFAPVLNDDLVLLRPDPFKLLVKGDNVTCSAKFVGLKNMLLSKSEKCVFGTNIEESYEDNMIVFPEKECIPFATFQKESESSKFYVREKCEAGNGNGMGLTRSIIQTKIEGHNIHVYCPGSTIKIGDRDMDCPNYVFVLPIGSNFSLNGVSHTVNTLQIVMNTSVVPAYSIIANTYLGRTINWSELKMEMIPETTAEPISGTGFWIISVIMILIAVLAGIVFVKFVIPTVRRRRGSRSSENGSNDAVTYNVGTEQVRTIPSFFSTELQIPTPSLVNVNETFNSFKMSNFFKNW